MTPSRHLPASAPDTAINYVVMAYATASVGRDEIKSLRGTLQPPGREKLPLSLLKHSDEQTVVALAAVLKAIDACGLTNHDFFRWGILSAARYLGREATAASIQRFLAEGAWGVSPHIIPHRSLHSVSGTLSQALGMRGPNFGVGGGLNGPSEIILAATAMLQDEQLPGVWIVITGWEPELIPARSEASTIQKDRAPICRGVALALTTHRPGWSGPRLQIRPYPRTIAKNVKRECFGCETLVAALERPAETMSWNLSGGGSVEWHGVNSGEEDRA